MFTSNDSFLIDSMADESSIFNFSADRSLSAAWSSNVSIVVVYTVNCLASWTELKL